MNTILRLTIIITFLFTLNTSFAQNNNSNKKDTSDVYIFPKLDTPPDFPGDHTARLEYFSKSREYPKNAIENNIQGTVYVYFIVEEDGRITNVKVLKGLSPDIDKEAIRIVELMPKWKPGSANGKTERSQFNMPVKFKIP